MENPVCAAVENWEASETSKRGKTVSKEYQQQLYGQYGRKDRTELFESDQSAQLWK